LRERKKKKKEKRKKRKGKEIIKFSSPSERDRRMKMREATQETHMSRIPSDDRAKENTWKRTWIDTCHGFCTLCS
jgi:hypothetical protein